MNNTMNSHLQIICICILLASCSNSSQHIPADDCFTSRYKDEQTIYSFIVFHYLNTCGNERLTYYLSVGKDKKPSRELFGNLEICNNLSATKYAFKSISDIPISKYSPYSMQVPKNGEILDVSIIDWIDTYTATFRFSWYRGPTEGCSKDGIAGLRHCCWHISYEKEDMRF